jgi:hypothetical protein
MGLDGGGKYSRLLMPTDKADKPFAVDGCPYAGWTASGDGT